MKIINKTHNKLSIEFINYVTNLYEHGEIISDHEQQDGVIADLSLSTDDFQTELNWNGYENILTVNKFERMN